MKDKVVKQDVKKDGLIYKLDFKFKFYPENVADEVIQDVTLKNLFVQVRISQIAMPRILVMNSGTSSPHFVRFHFVRFSLCARFEFSPKKFTLCDFLPFPHFVRTFYVIFEEFLIDFCKNVDSNHLGNNFVIFTRF